MTAPAQVDAGVRSLSATISRGLMTMAHNSFALIGLVVAFCALTLVSRDDLRHAGEAQLRSWLQARTQAPAADAAIADADVSAADDAAMMAAVDRATASNPQQLPRNQANVAYWLAKKCRVAPEPLAVLVSEAYQVGKDTKLPDYVILLSTLGGMALFGLNGFVIGPVIAALFIAAWDLFSRADEFHEPGDTQ